MICSGRIDNLKADAGKETLVKIPYTLGHPEPGSDYYLNLSFVYKRDTDFAPAGTEIGIGQFLLQSGQNGLVGSKADKAEGEKLAGDGASGAPAIQETKNRAEISGEGFRVVFDRVTGRLATYEVQGKTLITSGPSMNLWPKETGKISL